MGFRGLTLKIKVREDSLLPTLQRDLESTGVIFYPHNCGRPGLTTVGDM